MKNIEASPAMNSKRPENDKRATIKAFLEVYTSDRLPKFPSNPTSMLSKPLHMPIVKIYKTINMNFFGEYNEQT